MNVDTAIRKIKRQFGDEYNVIIVDEDIYYWLHEAELDIIRQTSSNDTKVTVKANLFPLNLPSRTMVKRVTVNDRPLVYTTRNELDSVVYSVNSTGTPGYWYWESDCVNLYPTPASTDTYSVQVIYSRIPPELNEGFTNVFTVPEIYHEDVVKFCVARAHNKNMNWKAAEAEMEMYDRNVSTRRNEAQSVDAPIYKGIDPLDYEESEVWL